MSESSHFAPRAAAQVAAPALRRLGGLAPLSAAETALVIRIAEHAEAHPAGADLGHSDGEPRPRLLLDGWACRQHFLSDGRRQILDFLLPGDLIGVTARPPAIDARPTVAVTPVLSADASALRDAIVQAPGRWPGLAAAAAAARSQAEAQMIDTMVRLGRQSAYERMAHLLLELHDRLAAAGLADGASFPLPLTQEMLADALALSVVHVNRVLQRLRAERRIAIGGGRATLLRPDLLALSAEYRSAAR